MFRNRIEAGTKLAEKLLPYKNGPLIVLAIPRGGLPIGAMVAKALNAPLDVALTKKIGHPYQREFAIGAVSLEDIVVADNVTVSEEYISKETSRIREILKTRYRQYYRHTSPQDLKNKTIIIVDDGIATGNTLLATIAMVKKQEPSKIIVAIPVAPSSGLQLLKSSPNVDEVICLYEPVNFRAVGQFYGEFPQVSDEEAIQWLEKTNTSKDTDTRKNK
ncbi:phosphoribosyltransferase [Maribacter polysaccharolyticus]|uniref:phosphoribosyltransferase n=1 Tax=Maribacter polysaccharolyticus TaxID=3020831 RepID=UPI00237F4959|nr:phosphoribosyltransferase family protein [Maribacter polysaccharolyticus]MDE3742564.1 phosphoribosyltransferase family protein [Maribacter polysaccharolyticus]